MALIPVQTLGEDHRGHVLVFDEGNDTLAASRWAIVDPESNPPRFWSFLLPVASPSGLNNNVTPGQQPGPTDGDIFCSGHAWTKDGKLFVAGGTVWDVTSPEFFWAARLVYFWDPLTWNVPPLGGWKHLSTKPLQQGRYYPSVTRFGNDRFLVSGGFDQDAETYSQGAGAVASTYEVFKVDLNDPLDGTWDLIPGSPPSQVYEGVEESMLGRGEFNFYPRFHLLADPTGGTNGWFFYAGFGADTARNVHDATQFTQMWDTTVGGDPVYGANAYLHYGSSVLAPIDLNAANTGEDRIMRFGGGLGGYVFGGLTVVDQVQICKPTAAVPDGQWQSLAPINKARMYCNAILLPDGSIFVVGGTSTEAPGSNFVMTSELLVNGIWLETGVMAEGRGYHSTAILLPNGMVLIAGGERVDPQAPFLCYQLYKPPYFFKGTRPVITSAVTGGGNPNEIEVGNATPTYELTYTAAPGSHAQRVVLMRPGSVTHHSDFEQRYVALEQVAAPDNTVRFKAPAHDRYTPLGHYMLFVVDNAGVPSEATWVKLL